MNSANRTLAFVLVAAASVVAAVGAHKAYQPSVATARTDVGTAFFPDFQDPSSATYLGVAAYNESASKVDKFVVERRDGQWRIPSHHNYPADAKDRVAKTAASIMGVTRGQLVDTTGASQKRLNLLDPLDEKIVGTEGRGSRITLKAGDTVLTDLIIGKKEEGTGANADRYYVRRADEDRVYIAEIRPDLSTKFTDWIQPNVLDATAATFRSIVLDRYSVDEAQGKIVPGKRSVLERNSTSDEWKLDDTPKGEKLKTSVVTQITQALGDMKIVGVRPKTPGIAALIKGDPKARRTAIDALDMQDKGYFDDGNGGIVSNEGDFLAGTSEGIMYVLRFGKVVLGEDVDIEIGSSKKLSEEEAQKALDERKAKEAEAAKPDDKPADAKKDDAKTGDEKKDAKKENRFLFVTAQVNEKLLGEPPVEPVKPEAPPGYQPKPKPADAPAAPSIPGFNDPKSQKPDATPAAPASEPKKETSALLEPLSTLAGPGPDAQDEKKVEPAEEAAKPAEPKAEEQKPADAKPADEKPQAAPAEGQPAAPPATGEKKPEAAKDPFAEYEAALAKYEQAMDEYKVKKGEYEERLKKAKDREKALNARFADWYYVIPADTFNTINVKPEELLEPESTPAAGAAPAGLPPGLVQPGGAPPVAPKPETPPAAAPATPPAGEPVADPAKPDAAKADAPKADAPPGAPETTEAPKKD
jgi:hypothetical protein